MRALLLTAALTLALPASAQTLVIGNKGEDTVSFVDLKTGREVRRVETAKAPHEVAISPDGARAAVVAYGGQTIDIFDVGTASLVERIDIAPNLRPHGLVWLKDGRIVATAEGSDSVAIVRASKEGAGERVRQIATGQKGSHMVAVSPDGSRAWVANMGSKSITAIDLAAMRKLGDTPVGKEPEGLALSPDGRRLWVADRGGDRVHEFDAATMKELGSVAVGQFPIRILVSPDGRHAVTSNLESGDLTVIDTATRAVTRTIPVGRDKAFGQVTLLFSADGKRLYAAETGIDRIAEIDFASGRVIGRLPAGKNGDGIAIAPVTVAPPES